MSRNLMVVLVVAHLFGISLCILDTVYFSRSMCDINYGSVLSTTTRVGSLLRCTAICEQQTGCASFVFKQDTGGTCVTNTRTTTSTGNLGACTVVKYTAILKRYCSRNADCSTPVNSECVSGYCRCKNGFSLTPSEGTCTPMCSTYGSTFQIFYHTSMNGFNDILIRNTNRAACENSCRTTKAITCRMFEFAIPKSLCLLSKETYYTQPGATTPWPDWIVGHRNCA